MVGMALVAQGEAESGHTALYLLQHGGVLQYATIALWVWASMVPILKGARHEAFGECRFLQWWLVARLRGHARCSCIVPTTTI